MLFWFCLCWIFVFGLVVGSFLNVCIWRMPQEMSVVAPPSRCTSCGTRLRPRDLVPVLSFLLHGRKCGYCKAPISWRYAIVETLTGIAFALLFLVDGLRIGLVFDVVFVAALIAIFAIDLEHYIIPDELNLVAAVAGIGRDVWGLATDPNHHALAIAVPGTGWDLLLPYSIVGLAAGLLVFWGIVVLGQLLFKKEAMGLGDVKLAMAIGANLGWVGALASFFLAVVSGAVLGLALMGLHVRKRDEQIPFGPFMVIGALAVVYCGQWVVPALLGLYSIHPETPVPLRTWQ